MKQLGAKNEEGTRQIANARVHVEQAGHWFPLAKVHCLNGTLINDNVRCSVNRIHVLSRNKSMARKDNLEDSLLVSKDFSDEERQSLSRRLLTRNVSELHSLASGYLLSYLVCQGKRTS